MRGPEGLSASQWREDEPERQALGPEARRRVWQEPQDEPEADDTRQCGPEDARR